VKITGETKRETNEEDLMALGRDAKQTTTDEEEEIH